VAENHHYSVKPPILALYGGTFDPIHHGHLILARDAMERLGAERVIFIPAAISPHKLHLSPSPAQARRAMVAAAIADEPRFELDDRELAREGPSFTIDTVEAIHGERPGAKLLYLLGTDNLAALETWHRIDDLRRLVEFVVLERSTTGGTGEQASLPRRLDISSTEIRDRIARGASIRYLVPESVRAIIESLPLYQKG
jgi:nicotinate-nucleotide adenylyltransferase